MVLCSKMHVQNIFNNKTTMKIPYYFTGSRGAVRYSINSGDPDGFFSIDQVSGNIRVANILDHERKSQILLNVQATSGDPPAYGHTQVIISAQIISFFFQYVLTPSVNKMNIKR